MQRTTTTNKRLKVMLEAALMAALATILSVVVPSIASFDIALGIIPIVIYSLRRGLKAGVLAGFLWGLLPILLGKASVLTLWQGLLEYPIANMVVGLAGLYANKIKLALLNKQQKTAWLYLFLAILISVTAKYLIHFYAGIVYWGKYTQWGLGPILYSLVINGGSLVINLVLTSIVSFAIVSRMPALISLQD